MNTEISGGLVHELPKELAKELKAHPDALAAWEKISPIARNEWICWITSPKQEKTRAEHLERTYTELAEGKKRPCCWIGCIHRNDKAMNSTQQWYFSEKRKPKTPVK